MSSYSEKNTTKQKIKIIPIRYIIAILLALLEVLTVIVIVVAFCYYVPYFYLLAWATQISCIIMIVASDDNPEYKVPWLLILLILPIAGFMLYFLFYKRQLNRRLLKRVKELEKEKYEYDDSNNFCELENIDITAARQAKMLTKISSSKLFRSGKIEYFSSGEAKHERLLSDLRQAKEFIFMEYFIVEEGKFWNSILEILKEKASDGVEVRFIYDDMGCMNTLPGDYFRRLRKYGIESVPFSILKGNADSEFNNRSHRKIAVIDGKVGYTGGINLADEYINAIVKHGHWKDVAVRIEGDGVCELTRLFLLDYGMNVMRIPEALHDYYPKGDNAGVGFCVPFGDGPEPMYDYRVAKSTIMNMLECAEKYVYITTPYLIIDNDVCSSIETAALKGVDIRIVTPHIPDKKIILEITRSFYPRLMKAGVRIYEYTPGFIHAKTYLCDDKCAMVGTVNMDHRSLVHNFECGAWMFGVECIDDIKRDIQKTFAVSAEITDDENDHISLTRRFIRAVGRVFSTLM